ncbi:hypothetical protein SNOG_04583 [Parastagonospora nodorum SN15]|uniref:Uncharacterized protein n=1 Tax=Phaeosphaeria nodorum (strain SN15 / ATCC MYA-4574 / FGSC 10173) TaxID=321614 RepID=Q0UUI1_PHANO|nr:hypothetical protein SNOG_04583 [Parastagonospora nodorum SN15]EAT88343.1 hypothetical protein SNOG_04583 [Parastagonospora nodorum SN15]
MFDHIFASDCAGPSSRTFIDINVKNMIAEEVLQLLGLKRIYLLDPIRTTAKAESVMHIVQELEGGAE